MRFSIIIPTCNRNDLLGKCLDGLIPGVQTIGEAYEVIVSDDGKHNEAKALLAEHYPWATWVQGPKRGPAANRNCGARLATGEWLVFLDDDCEPSAQLLEKYSVATVDYPQVGVFEGRISADRPKQRMDEEAPINETGGCLWSCNFMIRRCFFKVIGGFNEAFSYAAMEDVDLRTRVRASAEMVFAPDAFVVHPWRRTNKPAAKWRRVLEAHKVYLRFNPNDKAFRPLPFFKHMARAIFTGTVPDMLRFRAVGFWYAFYFHVFQLRLLAYLMVTNHLHGTKTR